MGEPHSPEASAPDRQPLVAAKAADAAVRRALVESHRQILGFLRRRLGSAEQAEDVLQAFVLKAIERSAEIRDVQTVRGWLSRILATTLIDHQRRTAKRRKREVEMSPSDLEAFPTEADSELDEAICNCLYKLLPTLKPEYAEVIWRVDLLSEPRDRVAASLGVTLNNINVRLHRGRQALRLRLEEMCLTCPEHGFLDCRCDEAERSRRRREELAENAEL